MASTDPSNAPEPIANDLNLLSYSYRQDPAIGPPTPPPTLMNGHQLTLINSFSENGKDVAGTINIDLPRDNSTGVLYVVARGSANLQNAQSDLQLANDPVTQNAIINAEKVLQSDTYARSAVEFVGHSLGGNLDLRLANDWINWKKTFNGLSTADIADMVSVHTYNPIGVPDVLPAMEQTLAPVTTIGAQVVRMEGKLGCLKPGAFADLLVVDGNPLKDLILLQEQSRHIAAIMKDGRFHKNRLHG